MTPSILLDGSAARRLREIGAGAGGQTLRLVVNGGGCSGFSYAFSLDATHAEGDLVVASDDGGHLERLVVDADSLPFLNGAVVAFEDNLIGARFVVRNPNAASSCGCGVSFAI